VCLCVCVCVCVAVNLPSGHVGLAESPDGLRFKRVPGKVAGGAVLGPREDNEDQAFDSLHVGIGDVRVR
jgi:hypothetical protein